MNLPVDRVDVHMDTHMFIVCFWKGRRRADRRARLWPNQSSLLPEFSVAAQDLFVPSSSGIAKEALNLETFLVTKGNKYIKQKCCHELQELQALIFSGRRHKASG